MYANFYATDFCPSYRRSKQPFWGYHPIEFLVAVFPGTAYCSRTRPDNGPYGNNRPTGEVYPTQIERQKQGVGDLNFQWVVENSSSSHNRGVCCVCKSHFVRIPVPVPTGVASLAFFLDNPMNHVPDTLVLFVKHSNGTFISRTNADQLALIRTGRDKVSCFMCALFILYLLQAKNTKCLLHFPAKKNCLMRMFDVYREWVAWKEMLEKRCLKRVAPICSQTAHTLLILELPMI